MFLVYFPLAHMVWGVDGFMNGVWNANASIKAIDFAGGTVVHMSSGWSALILCLMLGKRTGFGKKAFYPHSLVLTMIGTGMLWVGWYGFNAEWATRGRPSALGAISGAVAGLVVITPASGFVTANGAVLIGVLAGAIPYVACTKLKSVLGYDDALDTFGVHGVGGTLGALLTGFLANADANPNLNTNLSGLVGKTLWIEQIKAIGVTLTLAVVGTAVLGALVKVTIGLRPSPDGEEEGLDQLDHGEAGYHLEDAVGHRAGGESASLSSSSVAMAEHRS
jgi:Amt family ammonium transporter